MSYYEDIKKASSDLNIWIQDENRPSWSSFSRTMISKYGFGAKRMQRMLEEVYPSLSIEDDVLVRVKA